MNPNHYVSLPLAKRMKEAGFTATSGFYWKINWKETLKGWQDENGDLWDEQEVLRGANKYQSYFQLPEVDQKKYPPKYDLNVNETGGIPKEPFGADCYAAYSVAELADIIPIGFKIGKGAGKYRVYVPWCYTNNRECIGAVDANTMADAMALTALNLRERGII